MLSTHDSAARADSLVRRAHARAYRYPGGFEGFRAELAWRTDDASGRASRALRARGRGRAPGRERGGGARLGGQGAPLDRRPPPVQRVRKRRRRAREAARGDRARARRDRRARRLARVLVPRGGRRDLDRDADDGRPALHHRGARPVRRADGRAVPTSFSVFYWDAETGALTATEAYRDAVVDVDGIFLPSPGASCAGTETDCRCGSCALGARPPRRGGRAVRRGVGSLALAATLALLATAGSAPPPRRRSSSSRRRPSCRPGWSTAPGAASSSATSSGSWR